MPMADSLPFMLPSSVIPLRSLQGRWPGQKAGLCRRVSVAAVHTHLLPAVGMWSCAKGLADGLVG